MEKIKDLLEEKKMLVIGGGVLAVIIITILFVIIWTSGNSAKKLENSLKEMGKDFYENYYYDQTGKTQEERAKFLAKYASIGIKINLDNLGRYNSNINKEKIAEFVNSKTKESCNKENTKVIIYPKESYGKNDYTLEVELDCGFEEN